MLTASTFAQPITASQVLDAAFPVEDGAGAREIPLYIIPQGLEPRWMILGDPRRALPVLRSWRPWNPGSRARWKIVVLAAAAGMLARLPGVVKSRARIDFSFWRSISKFDENGTAVIHVGNPSHTRKAIVFFPGEGRRVQALAKVPLVPAAADAILHEAAILQRHQALLHLPSVLFQDFGRGVAVQSWLEGKPVSRSFKLAHIELLSSLANPGVVTRVSEFAPEIAAQLDSIDLPFDRSLLRRGLEMLECDRPLPGFLEHRDFAPWNLKRISDGSLSLIDWEWAELNSLPWQDICRYFYIQDALFNGRGKVYESMSASPLLKQFCDHFAIPRRTLPALTMHYLLRVLLMDWRAGNVDLAKHSFREIKSNIG
jgi:hypothetical protein